MLLAVTAVACLLIATWVRFQYTWGAAIVVGVSSTVALSLVWVNYEVSSISWWANGSLWRSLVVFVPPLILGAAILARRARAGSSPWWRSGAWLLLLAAGPALITFVPRLDAVGIPVVGAIIESAWSNDPQFGQLMWWAISSIAIFVVIPVLYARVFRQRIRDYGLSLAFVKTEIMLFVLVAPVIAALVWLATADLRFRHLYPFYSMQPDDPHGVTKLLIFEAVYGLSFVALEFFFRGFLVHAGSRVVGVHAVALMALSYCLIHLGKPMPECLSSLVGGLLLGFVSLRLKSIAVGVVAHLTMAWGTDAAVLWRSS